jgi:hypothetical protein
VVQRKEDFRLLKVYKNYVRKEENLLQIFNKGQLEND